MKKKIETDKAPAAIGPYSQAVIMGNTLFCSGQIGIDPKTNLLVPGGIEKQTKRVFENIKEILTKAEIGFDHVAKVNVYLQHMSDFAVMNELYKTYFNEPFPARATVEVAKLPKEALIEIDLIAYLKSDDGCCGGGECCGKS